MTLILTGFKNCGKSSVGRALKAGYGMDFLDTDDLIAAPYGTAREAFLSLGAAGFRALEEKHVLALEGGGNMVIATGGGVMMNPLNAAHLKSLGPVIYISVGADVLYARMMTAAVLPAFIDAADPEASFRVYYQDRMQTYMRHADHIVDGTGLTPEAIAHTVSAFAPPLGEPAYGQ